jgi:hypothetical protein
MKNVSPLLLAICGWAFVGFLGILSIRWDGQPSSAVWTASHWD